MKSFVASLFCRTEGIASLLTPNFMHALATNVSKKDSVLRPVAQLCMDQLGTVISQSADSDARTQVLLAVERHGNGFLVKLLKAHKIQEAQGSDADIVSRVKQLKKEFESSVEGGEGSSLGRQKSVLGQLAGIAKRQQGGVAVATDIFKFLVDKSFFKVSTYLERNLCVFLYNLQTAAAHFFIFLFFAGCKGCRERWRKL